MLRYSFNTAKKSVSIITSKYNAKLNFLPNVGIPTYDDIILAEVINRLKIEHKRKKVLCNIEFHSVNDKCDPYMSKYYCLMPEMHETLGRILNNLNEKCEFELFAASEPDKNNISNMFYIKGENHPIHLTSIEFNEFKCLIK